MPTLNRLVQFDMTQNTKVWELMEWLDYPEDIEIYHDDIYICDMGSKRILKLNITDRLLVPYLNFSEPVWEYKRTAFWDFVRLESWIYQINES